MGRLLRIAYRLPGVLAVTFGFFVLWLVGWPVARLSRRGERWRAFIFRLWGRVALVFFGVVLEVEGTAPEPPFFLVTNHLSYVDIPLLASRLDTVFVAKSEVASWPVVGTLCRAMGTVFIDRGSRRDVVRVIGRMRRRLEARHGVIVFPEGTTTDGLCVRPFLPSLLEAPVRLGHPVAWATLSYRTVDGDPPASLAVCWWGGMTLGDHLLRLLGLRRIEARLRFGAQPVTATHRKQLAEELRARIVADLFPPAPPAALPETELHGELQCL